MQAVSRDQQIGQTRGNKVFRHANFTTMLLLAGVCAGSICVLPAGAQSPAPAKTPAGAAGVVRYRPNFPLRANMFYRGAWGVDSFHVKWAESGEIVRFSYRVIDPNKAAALNDKRAEPTLIDPQAGVSLVVPEVANIGKMRQSSAPEAGKSYWMAFSNPGRPIRRGDRVNVVIGRFHADGLIVE
jgi:hypothetical protein